MITNFIQLDFNKENDLKVPSVQYDSGSRFVKIKLQRNKSPFEIDGYRVTVVANKVDGTEIMNDCTILDGVNGIVQFEITEQFNAVEGVVDCQLKLFKGETLLTSMPFSINVVKSVSTKEIVSSNELKTLVNALGEVQNIDNRFAQTNAQLSEKANKNEIFSMANMGQDVKEAMTGGSVAVVGKNAVIGYENIVDKTIPIEKTDFITPFGIVGTKNLYDKNNSDDYKLTVSADGNTIVPASVITSFVLEIKPNTTYSIEKVLSNRFWVATTSVKPVANTPINYQNNFYGQTKCTFTTTESDNFLLVAYYKTDDALTIDKIRNTIKVYEGSDWVDGSEKYEFKKLKITNENADEITSLPKLELDLSNIPNFLLPSLAYKPLGVLEKGYICMIADDGSTAFIDTTLPVLQQENVKYTLALMKDSPMFTVANKDSYINTLKNEITLKRCSICYHGGDSYTTYKPNELIDFLNSEKEFFESIGINPVGCCYPNHDHNTETQIICGNMLGICCDGNTGKYYKYQLNGARSNLYELTRTSLVSYGFDNLKLAINTAIDKKQLLILFWHDISLKNNPSYLQLLKDFISYAKTTDIEFITLNELENMI